MGALKEGFLGGDKNSVLLWTEMLVDAKISYVIENRIKSIFNYKSGIILWEITII